MTKLGAAVSLPALPLGAIAAPTAVSASAAVPNAARFWAIYMSHLHGSCSPAALAKMTSIDVTQAQGYLSKLVSDGVIKPNPFLNNTVGQTLRSKGDDLLDKIDKGLENLDQDLAQIESADTNEKAPEPPLDEAEIATDTLDQSEEDQNLNKDS